MAYVFGIGGVPIFEMLLVLCVLLLLGLFFILLELRKLTSLIGKEKADLKRFEDDLAELEKDTGKKSTDEIVQYIKGAVAKGMPRAQIEVSLIQRGWPKKEIDTILDQIGGK
jgi:hypothetical protein